MDEYLCHPKTTSRNNRALAGVFAISLAISMSVVCVNNYMQTPKEASPVPVLSFAQGAGASGATYPTCQIKYRPRDLYSKDADFYTGLDATFAFNWRWVTIAGVHNRVVTIERSGSSLPSPSATLYAFPDNLKNPQFGPWATDSVYFSWRDIQVDNGSTVRCLTIESVAKTAAPQAQSPYSFVPSSFVQIDTSADAFNFWTANYYRASDQKTYVLVTLI